MDGFWSDLACSSAKLVATNHTLIESMERNWSMPNPSDPGGECHIYRPRPYGLYYWESILGMDTNEERSCAILAQADY